MFLLTLLLAAAVAALLWIRLNGANHMLQITAWDWYRMMRWPLFGSLLAFFALAIVVKFQPHLAVAVIFGYGLGGLLASTYTVLRPKKPV